VRGRNGGFGGRNALWWAPPLLVLAVNLVWTFAFGSGSRIRAADLGRRVERARAVDADLAERLQAREALWAAANRNRDEIERLFTERLSTESERFTDSVRELYDLAERSRLRYDSIAYPRESLEGYGLVRKSFVFSVTGTYADLRTFLNLLDLTPSFLVLDQISVAESGGERLAIQLRLSTYFTDPERSAPAESGG